MCVWPNLWVGRRQETAVEEWRTMKAKGHSRDMAGSKDHIKKQLLRNNSQTPFAFMSKFSFGPKLFSNQIFPL